MIKLEYTEKKGLVQKPGAGVDLTLGGSTGQHEMTTTFKVIHATSSLDPQDTTHIITFPEGVVLPANSLILASKLEMLVPDADETNITALGISANDTLMLDGELSASSDEVVLLPPTALEFVGSESFDSVLLTTDDNPHEEAMIKITICYMQLQ